MSREDPHFRLRFPNDLREKVEAAARGNKRSMTAEIIHRLERSFMSGHEIEAVDLEHEQRNLRARLDRLEEQAKEWAFETEIEAIFERVVTDVLKKREIISQNEATRERLRRRSAALKGDSTSD